MGLTTHVMAPCLLAVSEPLLVSASYGLYLNTPRFTQEGSGVSFISLPKKISKNTGSIEMKLNNRHLLVLTIASATGNVAMAGQAESEGFIADSHLDFTARNLYWNHDAHRGHNNEDSTADH